MRIGLNGDDQPQAPSVRLENRNEPELIRSNADGWLSTGSEYFSVAISRALASANSCATKVAASLGSLTYISIVGDDSVQHLSAAVMVKAMILSTVHTIIVSSKRSGTSVLS